MNLYNSLIEYDKKLLLFLHAKGSETFDDFWLFITNPLRWVPLFFVLLFLSYKSIGLKKTVFSSLLIALSGVVALHIVNSIKNATQRLRPVNDSSINNSIRVLIEPTDFSFVSGHATVSFVIVFICYWILKKQYKYVFLLFLFPLLFSYSRIYLAVHFPIDVLAGTLLGFIIALFFYKLIQVFVLKK